MTEQQPKQPSNEEVQEMYARGASREKSEILQSKDVKDARTVTEYTGHSIKIHCLWYEDLTAILDAIEAIKFEIGNGGCDIDVEIKSEEPDTIAHDVGYKMVVEGPLFYVLGLLRGSKVPLSRAAGAPPAAEGADQPVDVPT
jgi:hypothetical protein